MLRPVSGPCARFALLALSAVGLASAQTAAAPALNDSLRTWTVGLQGGFTNTFQLVLGGYFGDGPDFQNRASVGINNAFRKGDALTAFGWSATDLPTRTPNWQAGLTYKTLILKKGRHTLTNTSGLQRWVLPMVKTGAMDWHYTNTVTYATRIGNVPITASADSWHMFKSTLPLGNAVYNQVYAQHPLWKKPGYLLAFKHGPAYTYSWGLYGANGNRVFRYTTAMVVVARGTSFEGGMREQWGLQNGIKKMRFWSFLVSRSFTGPFHKK
jgi:hypothetical protein